MIHATCLQRFTSLVRLPNAVDRRCEEARLKLRAVLGVARRGCGCGCVCWEVASAGRRASWA